MPEEDNPRTPDDDSLIQGKNLVTQKVTAVIFRNTPTCAQMTRLISEELDRPLPLATRLRMRIHFLACCYCERYKKNIRFLRSFLLSFSKHLDEISNETLSPEAKERLKTSLRGEDPPGA